VRTAAFDPLGLPSPTCSPSRPARLGELRRPAETDELARRLELHPNGVRVHLDRLRRAGLVLRERARQARGRLRDEWSLSPDSALGVAPPRASRDLAR
jgi:predicted ArsR family transcriptional regulator